MFVIPFINPLRFTKQGYHTGYNTKFFDEFPFPETIREWESQEDYYEPWAQTDILRLFFYTDVDPDVVPISLDFVREEDNISIHSGTVTALGTLLHPTLGLLYILKVDEAMTPVPEGSYRVVLAHGLSGSITAMVIESNKIHVCDVQPETVLIQYYQTKSYQDVLFEKDDTFSFFIRVHGFIDPLSPDRDCYDYIDQVRNVVNLKTVPFNTWRFSCRSEGLPWYMMDILNKANGCKSLFYDGRQFVIPATSKWEKKEEDNYPLRGISIEMLEAKYRSSIAWLGITGGGATDPVDPERDLMEDHWLTPTGLTELGSARTSDKYGIRIDEMLEVLYVAREGLEHDLVSVSSPVGRQAKHDTILKKVLFDPTIPFDVNPNTGNPETVKMIFYK